MLKTDQIKSSPIQTFTLYAVEK